MNNLSDPPKFQLQKIYTNGKSTTPEIYELHDVTALKGCHTARRGFLKVTALGAGVLGVLSTSGCIPDLSLLLEPDLPVPDVHTNLAIDNEVKVKDFSDLRAHPGHIYSLAFSPDGKILASGGYDQSIKLWSIPDGKLLKTLKRHTDWVYCLQFSQDGNTLISGSNNGEIVFWKKPFTKPHKTVADLYSLSAVKISLDGTVMVCQRSSNFQLRSMPDLTIMNTLSSSRVWNGWAFSNDSSKFAIAFQDKYFSIYDLPSGNLLKEWDGIGGGIVFSIDGTFLISRHGENLDFWNVESAKLQTRINLDKDQASENIIAMSQDGKWLATPLQQRDILLFSKPFPNAKATLLRDDGKSIHALAFSPDNKYLASATSFGTLTLWRLPNNDKPAERTTTFVDLAAVDSKTSVRQANVGHSTFVGPCGSPLPHGAICTCNCVPGQYIAPTAKPSPTPNKNTGNYYCTCNKICTCVPIK